VYITHFDRTTEELYILQSTLSIAQPRTNRSLTEIHPFVEERLWLLV